MRKLIRDRNLHDIAAAIRTKNGSNTTYKPSEMSDAIRALPSPGTMISKTITQNGSYSPQSENADGYSSVTVNVGRNLVHKTITRNGSFSAASDNVDGYSSVSVNVPNSYSSLDEGKVVSGGALTAQTSLNVTQNGTFDTTRNNQVTVNVSGGSGSTLVSKTITANGTYNPVSDNADGYDWVDVAVPGGFDTADEGKVVLNGALMPQTSLNVTQNGTYDTTAKNSVVVNVSGGNLVSKTITENGTYNPFDDNADGYSTVAVNVSSDSGSSLPAAYQEVEYVSFQGGQYFTVPVSGVQWTRLYTTSSVSNTSSPEKCVIGNGDLAAGQRPEVWYAGTVLGADQAASFAALSSTSGLLGYGQKGGVSANQVYYTETSYGGSVSTSARKLYVGQYDSSGSYPFSGKIYRIKLIKKDAFLLPGDHRAFELVPCYRKSDDEIGFYDIVNNAFYTNEGTGNFGKGSDVN